MGGHVLRPLWVVLVIVGLLLVARYFYVPDDFGIGERGFMYAYHRFGNEQEWKDFKIKYMTKDYCEGCHPDKVESVAGTKHEIIQCENCHGPAVDHPDDPPKLVIDKSRELCIRCHAKLPYPSSMRGEIRGIDPATHNPDMACSMCHNPHNPGEGGWK